VYLQRFKDALDDHQGSVAALTDATGNPIVNESFTPFGARRNPSTWSGSPTNSDLTTTDGITQQGYTFQTTLGLWTGLNHMNGRVQDAVTGRFLSADPFVPDPTNTQDYNRYSYVDNNPLSLIDPSGFDEDGCADSASGCTYRDPDGTERVVLPPDIVYGNPPPVVTPPPNPPSMGVMTAVGDDTPTSQPQWHLPGLPIDVPPGQEPGVESTFEEAFILTTGGAEIKVGATLLGAGIKALAAAGARDAAALAAKREALGIVDMGRASLVTKASRAIGLPGWSKVTVDMAHIAKGHMTGTSLAASKSVFVGLNEQGVLTAIKQAYATATKISMQGERVLLSGTTKTGMTVEMWLNRATNMIETAYPVVAP
jgi:RHS repeat-associated protein